MLKTMAILPRFRVHSQLRAGREDQDGPTLMRCPRCLEGRLISWDELSDEDREVVRRLPESPAYSMDERKAMHRWCTNCWYEETESTSTDA